MDLATLEVASVANWRSWLHKNHRKKPGVWLLFYRKASSRPALTYDEALDTALAYGWIDSIIKKIDNQRYVRKFTPRRPWSIWSSQNISRVNRLKSQGRMTRWGLEAFAKRTPEISLLEKLSMEGLKVPEDFEKALMANEKARANFERFTPGYRKRYLIWISGTKRRETRQKRINEAVKLIARNVKALLK